MNYELAALFGAFALVYLYAAVLYFYELKKRKTLAERETTAKITVRSLFWIIDVGSRQIEKQYPEGDDYA